MLSLIQKHTVEIYQLARKECQIKRVKARSLLSPKRFDLFAKLFYIANASRNRDVAIRVYTEHIKAFNPDGKEPGREDKHNTEDFICAFNKLIEEFKTSEFDDSVSIVPVDKNGIILDGAHRVAALAFYDKDIVIAQFFEVCSKADFDFVYFKNRGLAWDICDLIASEMLLWLNDSHVACLWPKMTSRDKELAYKKISLNHTISYQKDIKISLSSLVYFVKTIYSEQDWTKSKAAVEDKAMRCYRNNSMLSLVFFTTSDDLDALIKEKKELRNVFGDGKDSLHITDNNNETIQIANLTLNINKLKRWNKAETGVAHCFKQRLNERILYFKKIQWIDFKVSVARLLKKMRIR